MYYGDVIYNKQPVAVQNCTTTSDGCVVTGNSFVGNMAGCNCNEINCL